MEKKLFYYCVQCKEIFGCLQKGKQVKCSVCETPCRWDGAGKKYFKFDIGQEQLSHGICNVCYYMKKKDKGRCDMRRWLFVLVFLLLLGHLPLADFNALSDEQKQALLQAAGQAYFESNPKCQQVAIAVLSNGEEAFVIGECVRWQNDVEL